MPFFPIVASIQRLHIPDGFLSLPMSIVCWLLSALLLALALRAAQATFEERLIPLAGIMAAFIFAGQMINFPVAGGTSGHLLGATLAAIMLGPWLGLLVMASVIGLQALLFQDGGLLVMGANFLVMGAVPVMVGYGLYRLVLNGSRRVKLLTAAFAAWLSILAAAFVTALMLGLSGTSSLRIAIPAMLGVHAFIGLGEALITGAALSFIMRTRPALLTDSDTSGSRGWIAAGAVVTLGVLLLAPLASSSPDGLESVAAQLGFMERAVEAPIDILPGYNIPALGEGGLSTILAGLVGAVVVAAAAVGLARLAGRGRQKNR